MADCSPGGAKFLKAYGKLRQFPRELRITSRWEYPNTPAECGSARRGLFPRGAQSSGAPPDSRIRNQIMGGRCGGRRGFQPLKTLRNSLLFWHPAVGGCVRAIYQPCMRRAPPQGRQSSGGALTILKSTWKVEAVPPGVADHIVLGIPEYASGICFGSHNIPLSFPSQTLQCTRWRAAEWRGIG